MNRRPSIKVKAMREHETISLQTLFMCLCVCVYDYAILFLVLLTSNRLWAHHASEMPRVLIALRLRSGSCKVGTSEHWMHPREHLVVVSISLFFLLLLEYIFDVRICDLSFLHIESLLWEVWRCLDFQTFDLSVLSIQRFTWELWRRLGSNSTWLKKLDCWKVYLRA